MKKTFVTPQRTKLLSLRTAKRSFRLDAKRDDHNPGAHTAYVFATRSPSLAPNSDSTGVYGAPMGVLNGYKQTTNSDGVTSVRLAEGAFILGRLVELSHDEIARLDQVAEQISDGHRFLAEIVSPQTGYRFAAWVYQLNIDRTSVEDETSADTLSEGASKALQGASR